MFLFQRQWTVLKLLGIMGCGDNRRRSSLLWAQFAFLGAAEFYVCTWFSLFTAVWPLQIWCCLMGLLGCVGRGPKQTWWSARKLAPQCCKLSCSASWQHLARSAEFRVSHPFYCCEGVRDPHGERGSGSRPVIPPSSAGPRAAERSLTVGVLGSCPSVMLNPHRGLYSGFYAQFHISGGLLCPLILCWAMAGISLTCYS